MPGLILFAGKILHLSVTLTLSSSPFKAWFGVVTEGLAHGMANVSGFLCTDRLLIMPQEVLAPVPQSQLRMFLFPGGGEQEATRSPHLVISSSFFRGSLNFPLWFHFWEMHAPTSFSVFQIILHCPAYLPTTKTAPVKTVMAAGVVGLSLADLWRNHITPYVSFYFATSTNFVLIVCGL